MKIEIERKRFTSESTISDVRIDGQFVGHILEDTDRGLNQIMKPAEIARRKVWGQTAIPAGSYEVVISFSNRFQRMLPLLLNVPGFLGIRIHSGNTARDTEGCLLPGLYFGTNKVLDSRTAFSAWMLRIQSGLRTGKVILTITRDEAAYAKFLAQYTVTA